MGWAEPHTAGPGTTAQIEAAHAKLDELHVPGGTLAERTLALSEELERCKAAPPR
jgi:hypothetical protein